jgi:RHS repeat-associated protein
MTDARGVTISSVFDAAGQLTGQTSPNESRSFTYDGAGRMSAWTDNTGTTTQTFDDAGRVTSVAAPAGTVSYSFNAAGERTSMTQPEGVVAYTYDVNGYQTSVTDWQGGTVTIDNDPDGRIQSVSRSNGVNTVHGFDAAGRLTGIDHAGPGGSIDSFTYTLDPNGNRTAVTSTAGTESYTLDELNRLTNVAYPDATAEVFAFDPASNRTSHTRVDGTTVGYTVDAAGQIISDTDGTTYSYDAAGNLTSTSSGDVFSYDDYGRMVTATADGASQTYTYDATDVRTSVDGQGQLWDRTSGLPTLVSDGADTYLHTGAGITRTGTDWHLADALGSVRATTDNTGNVVDSLSFTAFGETLSGTGVFGFTGQQQDPTGLHHLRARQYAPGLGRFTGMDPVQPGAPGTPGWNLYGYAGSNPTTLTDPTGRVALSGYAIESSDDNSAAGSTAQVNREFWRIVGREFGVRQFGPGLVDGSLLTLGVVAGLSELAASGGQTPEPDPPLVIAPNAYTIWADAFGVTEQQIADCLANGLGSAACEVLPDDLIATLQDLGLLKAQLESAIETAEPVYDWRQLNDGEFENEFGDSAEVVKKEIVGDPVSRFDLFVDKNTGRVFILRKGGTGEPQPTGYRFER